EQNMTVFDQFSPEALTPAYATCEMLRWEPPDIRDDVYSFGCVAYEILTGKHPFNKMPALKAAKAGLSPPPVKGLPKQQWQAIKSTLEFKREDRMPDIVHFLKTGYGNRTGRRDKSSYLVPAAGFLMVIALVIWQAMTFLNQSPKTISGPSGAETPRETDLLPERKGPPPTPETQRKIDRILKIAESHVSIGRIVEPSGSSALDAYQTILELDPESPEARSGMTEALRVCEQEARTEWKSGEMERAAELAGLCLSFKPNHPGLKQLQAELEVQGQYRTRSIPALDPEPAASERGFGIY
ncbi:MAG: hypothetical protein ACRERU_05975, partial [Methylococcales bacterium]